MKFHLKKIGPIKDATIELGRMTIVAGQNNTGKTYMTYSLYGLFRLWNEYDLVDFGAETERIIQDLLNKREAFYDPKMFIAEHILSGLAKRYSKRLAQIFSANSETFEKASIDIKPSKQSDNLGKLQKGMPYLLPGSKLQGDIVEVDGRRLIRLQTIIDDEKKVGFNAGFLLQSAVNRMLADMLISGLFPRPFISTAERLGITLFYKELDVRKNVFVEHIQKMSQDKRKRSNPWDDVVDLVNKEISRYAMPIRANIDYVRDLSNVRKGSSSFSVEKLEHYISDMMEGTYKQQGDEVWFSSKKRGENHYSIPLYESSTSVRALSDIFFYLKHSARKGDLLMIDEPESHLTPQNQIVIARLLAACVNAGIDVYVTTHSDYLIKEINNLIMLHNLPEEQQDEWLNRKGSPYKRNEFLDTGSVKAYICKNGTLTPCLVDNYGIEVQSMDEAINSINETSEELSAMITMKRGC